MSSRANEYEIHWLSSYRHKNNRPKTQPSSQTNHRHYHGHHHRLNSELKTESENREDWMGAEGKEPWPEHRQGPGAAPPGRGSSEGEGEG